MKLYIILFCIILTSALSMAKPLIYIVKNQTLPAYEEAIEAITSELIATYDIEEIIMGCVLQAGIGQAPARQAGFNAGLSKYIPAVTVNKMCGSGLKTVIMGSEQIKAKTNNVLVSGGMESMTNAPYLSKHYREGARIGTLSSFENDIEHISHDLRTLCNLFIKEKIDVFIGIAIA